jgi:serine phosphatase RsbU (regulator of sigma subunit)
MRRLSRAGTLPVLGFGVVALVVACLSILDMFLPRASDGVVLDPDRSDLLVRSVLPESGAAAAGIRSGDRIVGIDRIIVRTPSEAARALQQQRIGQKVPYLVERDETLVEVEVELGRRSLGTPLYLYACFLGFLFFVIGLYVLLQRPDAPPGSPAHVFFILCTLFLLFLVCRLRPASYSWVDGVVLTTGTLSLLALPAAFLHFFLVFPRRLTAKLVPSEGEAGGTVRFLRAVERFLNTSPYLFPILYLLPPSVYAGTLLLAPLFAGRLRVVSGAPVTSWVLMGDYLVLGLLALLASLLQAEGGRERRQIATIFAGTVLGVTPFLVLGVAFPSVLNDDRYVLTGVLPLVLVPLTFGYAIVRFQFFDIRIIVRRSLLYTATTAVVSGSYAVGIAVLNFLFRDAELGQSPIFPLLLAVAIVLLFDPLRRRLQVPVDRFFFREVYDARRAVEEISEALAREFSRQRLEELLTARLSEVLHLEWVSLYRQSGGDALQLAGNANLPAAVPTGSLLVRELSRIGKATRLAVLEPLKMLDPACRRLLDQWRAAGARLVVPLLTRETLHALLLVGAKRSEEEFSSEDLQLINTVANQGAIAMENARLLEEKTLQVELEKELEIARRVQFSLIPTELPRGHGWELAGRCRPARQVGGDFFDALAGPQENSFAVVVGDVSGKSVAGAMLMVAAREILQTAALAGAAPERIMEIANRGLYRPGPRLFVALAYLLLEPSGRVTYALAGQPAPLLRRGGVVESLPFPEHRLPLGALRAASWDTHTLEMAPGDVLLVYSDGVTDTRGANGEAFGCERLEAALAAASGTSEEILASLMAEIERFAVGAEPYDDMTLLVVARGEP